MIFELGHVALPAAMARGFARCAALLLVNLSIGLTHGQDRLADSQGADLEFGAVLEQVRESMQDRKWKEGQRLLLDALDSNPDPQAVRLHWTEIEEALARCSFWKEYTLPSPKDAVSGELLSWKESSGAIKLRYRKGNAGLAVAASLVDGEERGDFLSVNNLFIHPLKFTGTYHIEIKGKDLPERASLPVALVAWNWDTGLGLPYGVAFGDRTRVFSIDGRSTTVIGEASTTIRHRGAYNFKVSVSASSISAFYNNKLLLKASRPKGQYGQLGFSNVVGLDEVVITGEVEPSWIAGKLDARVQSDWKRFRSEFDPFQDLPAWVAKAVAGKAKSPGSFGASMPKPEDQRNEQLAIRALDYHNRGEFEDGLRFARQLMQSQVTSSSRQWLMAHFLSIVGKYEEALGHLDGLLQTDREFFPGRMLRARLVRYLRGAEEGTKEFELLARDFPGYVEVYEELVGAQMNRGRIDQAEEIYAKAIQNGVPAQALQVIGRNILRAKQGPTWHKTYTFQTKNYIVCSDLSKQACYEIGEELEKFYLKYSSRILRPKKTESRRFQVYFFSGQAGYNAYCQDLLGFSAESTAGLFSMGLKQLLIWNSPEKNSMLRTVRHEGFHQYLDCITEDAPVWLHEGMAEYFEGAKLVNGRWQDDQVNEYHLQVLAGTKPWTELRELVSFETGAFRAKPSLHYAQAWAFVHFMLNSSAETEQRIDGLLDALFAGSESKQALSEAFSDVDWAQLEEQYRAHVRSLGGR